MNKEVKPYENPLNKKKQVEQMFDKIAIRYDLLNRFLTFGIDNFWRKTAVKKIENNPTNILDIATGTADLAIIASKITNAKVVGIDISNKMLDLGREKASFIAKNVNQRIRDKVGI